MWVGGLATGFVVYFVSQWWKCSVLDIFVYSAAFVVGGVVTVAEDAFDLLRPFRTWAMFGAVFSGAFDTPWAYGNSRLEYSRISGIYYIEVYCALGVEVRSSPWCRLVCQYDRFLCYSCWV